MPITEALKKLIKTITGKNAVGETIEELVQNLNDNYPEGGGGGSVTVDSELSETSENPVQNKVIMAALAQLADMIDSDAPIVIPGTIDGSTAVSTLGVPLETIYQAFAAGQLIYFEADVGGACCRYPCTSVGQNGSNHIVTYAAPFAAGGTSYVAQIKFDGSDTNGTFTMGS